MTSARGQVLLAGVIGLIAAVPVGVTVAPSLAALVGFDAAAMVYVGWVWVRIWPLDASTTKQHAAREDPTRAAADLLLLVAALAGLAGVAAVIAQADQAHGGIQSARIAVGVASVVVAWALVHTVFTLKYARLYYAGKPGGVDFKTDIPPPYSDFAYLAFTIGMTFQVSDTDLQHPDFRRLALRHALLSYLLGTVIVASMINLVAGLVH